MPIGFSRAGKKTPKRSTRGAGEQYPIDPVRGKAGSVPARRSTGTQWIGGRNSNGNVSATMASYQLYSAETKAYRPAFGTRWPIARSPPSAALFTVFFPER